MAHAGHSKRGMVKYLIARSPIFFLSVFLVLLVEFLDRGNIEDTFIWCFINFNAFLMNFFITLCLILLFISITGRFRTAYWIVSVFLVVVALVSGVKFKMLGVPLLPWDIVLGSETADISHYLKGVVPLSFVVVIALFLLVSLFMSFKVRGFRLKIRGREKLFMLAMSVVILFVIYSDKPVAAKDIMGIKNIGWDQAENYKTNGFALSTILNADQVIIEKPAGYDESSTRAIAKEAAAGADTGQTKIKPNVIVVLSEAFWDPTIMKEISFDRDPIPFFHSLQQQYQGGWLLSPQFGGGTANVEFEVLTGLSTRFLPQGSIAYNQYITKGVDSMASILSRQGYTSTAINPFHNWFFNSKTVYQNFGFSKFISSEFFAPNYKGPFLADDEVAKIITSETDKSPGPDFVFANTMENHAPFYKGKFEKNTFQVQGPVSDESKEILETYATGIADADALLKTLVDHYTQVNEPTVVVFFGDHMPLMGNNYKVYKESNYLTDNDPDFVRKMYSTPVVVWNNYLPEHKDQFNISPSFLSSYVLKLTGLQGTYFTDFLDELSKKQPIIPPNYKSLTENSKEIGQYKQLQYDILFGDRYGYRPFVNRIVDSNFVLGFGAMIADSVKTGSAGGKTDLIVKGKNFVPGGILYLDDKRLATAWSPDGSLTAIVPEEILNKTGRHQVDVRVLDSKDMIIARTNALDVTSLLAKH